MIQRFFIFMFIFVGFYQKLFSFDYLFVGYINKNAIFKNNTKKPAYLFSPEDTSYYFGNADHVLKISDLWIIYQNRISDKKYQIIIFNRKQNINIDTVFTNTELFPWDIDIDSSLSFIAYSRMDKNEQIILRNLNTKTVITFDGLHPKFIKDKLYYFNYSNPDNPTEVSGTIFSIEFKNKFIRKKVIMENVIYDAYRIYPVQYLIFGRLVMGEGKFFLFDMQSKEMKIIERNINPGFSYYSFKKNKIIFYDDNNGKLILKEFDPKEFMKMNKEKRF